MPATPHKHSWVWLPPRGWQPVPGIAGTPGSRPTLPGARQGVGLGFVNTFRDGGTEPATGTGPQSAGLGCSGAGREQCGVPAAPVPPHPSQPLHLARRPASTGRSSATTKRRGGNRSRWTHSRPTADIRRPTTHSLTESVSQSLVANGSIGWS